MHGLKVVFVDFFQSYHYKFPLCIMKCITTYNVYYRYFYHIVLPTNAILKMPMCLRIWNDPISNKLMYKKDLPKEWSTQHLPHCGWYVNFYSNYTPSSEISLLEQFDVRFVEKLIIAKVDNKGDSGRHNKRKNKKKLGITFVDIVG